MSLVCSAGSASSNLCNSCAYMLQTLDYERAILIAMLSVNAHAYACTRAHSNRNAGIFAYVVYPTAVSECKLRPVSTESIIACRICLHQEQVGTPVS